MNTIAPRPAAERSYPQLPATQRVSADDVRSVLHAAYDDPSDKRPNPANNDLSVRQLVDMANASSRSPQAVLGMLRVAATLHHQVRGHHGSDGLLTAVFGAGLATAHATPEQFQRLAGTALQYASNGGSTGRSGYMEVNAATAMGLIDSARGSRLAIDDYSSMVTEYGKLGEDFEGQVKDPVELQLALHAIEESGATPEDARNAIRRLHVDGLDGNQPNAGARRIGTLRTFLGLS